MATIADDTLASYGVDADGALSARPGGECGTVHSSDEPAHPLRVERDETRRALPAGWAPPARTSYPLTHGEAG